MSRPTLAALSSYLLDGHLVARGCTRLLRSRRTTRSQFCNSVATSSTASRLAYVRALATAATTSTSTQSPTVAVPYRKQQKDAAKAAKATGTSRKSRTDVSNQIVPGWELTVGIEIHAQLNTDHKLFSSASIPSLTDDPNSRVAPFDLAIPGSQPVFQAATLIPAIRAALALNCEIQPVSRWDRKHYFHWDQPSGFQLTQYYEPFARNGHIVLHPRDRIYIGDGAEKESVTVGIQQIQMEQDTAKTLAQPPGDIHWLDFNRAGAPLIEIITKPDIHHPATAAAFVRKIANYLQAVDACTTGMELGGLRADVNVSVRRVGDAKLGTRTEIKNLSSVKAVEDAIIAERDRQIAVLSAGGTILGETRGWSLGSTETRRLRGKEGEVDYRYMPDPELGPVYIGQDLVEHLKTTMGVLPDEEVDILCGDEYGLSGKDALSLVEMDAGGRIEYYYKVLDHLEMVEGKTSAATATVEVRRARAQMTNNWVLHELGKLTSDKNVDADRESTNDLGIAPDGECALLPAGQLAEILFHLRARRITNSVAKELLFAIFRGDLRGTNAASPRTVSELIDAENLWWQELSDGEYAALAEDVIEKELDTLKKHFVGAKKYPSGKLMFLLGKMMRLGPEERIDPKKAEEVLKRIVDTKVETMVASKA